MQLTTQSKGRIERLWRTLQDRLTKELRLAGITNLEEATAFLPGFIERYNRRFAKVPQDPNSAWVPLPADLDTNYYFAIRESRKVRSDNCISWYGQQLQLLPGPKDPSLVERTISVHTVPEGDIYVYHDRHPVAHRPVASDPLPLKPTPKPKPIRQSKPVDPNAKARQRAWLFAQG